MLLKALYLISHLPYGTVFKRPSFKACPAYGTSCVALGYYCNEDSSKTEAPCAKCQWELCSDLSRMLIKCFKSDSPFTRLYRERVLVIKGP